MDAIGIENSKRIENIIRKEMKRVGALEILMPAIQPAELWKESGRWDKYGPELLEFLISMIEISVCPTHEEITDIVRIY